MEQNDLEDGPIRPNAEMVQSIANCALAIGHCVYQGAKLVIALRDTSSTLRKSVQRDGSKILKLMRRGPE